ncbi:MAG: glycine zipper 2TM domain-containing protein [Alphaproteobacteria bacterium]|nr:glycine zipper 2TM domain-containing protein [Alphaproteobacteria bacterium]
MSLTKMAIVAGLGLALVACEGAGPKQGVGTVVGAVGGGVAGAQFGRGQGQLIATAAGALLGAFLGGEVGKSLDRADRLSMERTTQQTLERTPTGQASEWRNPDSGNSGTVTPTRTYQKASGEQCREFTQTVSVGGKSEQAYGTACRQPDGTWKIVSG